jgi:hypothetical protein
VCPGHVFKWGKRGGAALSFYGLESKPREEGGTQFGMAHSKKKMGGGGGVRWHDVHADWGPWGPADRASDR